MRRDIDPIKIIKILPLSGRSGKSPQDPNPWSDLIKKAFQASKEAAKQMSTKLQDTTTRVRVASHSFHEAFVNRVRRMRPQGKKERPISDVLPPPAGDASSAAMQQHGHRPQTLAPRTPNAAAVWLLSVRKAVETGWPAQRSRLKVMKNNIASQTFEWGERIRQACGTRSWRKRTEQVVRPLASAVRSLRRRHQTLLDELKSTQSLVHHQQEEITKLSSQIIAIETDVAAHKKMLEELTSQLNSLQAKVAQTLPTTQGTTGQSGPPPQARRGTPNKRNGQSEPEPQSRAEH